MKTANIESVTVNGEKYVRETELLQAQTEIETQYDQIFFLMAGLAMIEDTIREAAVRLKQEQVGNEKLKTLLKMKTDHLKSLQSIWERRL